MRTMSEEPASKASADKPIRRLAERTQLPVREDAGRKESKVPRLASVDMEVGPVAILYPGKALTRRRQTPAPSFCDEV